MGVPIEESVLALAPVGAAILSGAAVIARSRLAELAARLRVSARSARPSRRSGRPLKRDGRG